MCVSVGMSQKDDTRHTVVLDTDMLYDNNTSTTGGGGGGWPTFTFPFRYFNFLV